MPAPLFLQGHAPAAWRREDRILPAMLLDHMEGWQSHHRGVGGGMHLSNSTSRVVDALGFNAKGRFKMFACQLFPDLPELTFSGQLPPLRSPQQAGWDFRGLGATCAPYTLVSKGVKKKKIPSTRGSALQS